MRMRFTKTMLFALLTLWTINASALNILLTNDDGYDHPWIQTLHQHLVEAGHQVTMIAPSENQSGKGASLTLARELRVDNPAEGIYAVHGTPATTVILGVKGLLADSRPDLIISGINEGANIGAISAASGTVGATVAGLHMVGGPISGIAISADPFDRNEPMDQGENLEQAKRVSDFMVRLVASLEERRKPGHSVLPTGLALNVNYPAVAPQEIQGVGLFPHGKSKVSFSYKRQEPGVWGINFSLDEGSELDPQRKLRTDTEAFSVGYITISPINGDYTSPNWKKALPRSLVKRVEAL